ncbi:unnamed protein product [Miscanthus lutarioriparius]|uniref:SGNH hydrolase-type esterase domain-containing protein n=1 Tax=Miscanthus lutarioriparius TaxID=422564 RepID=A0A811N8Q1_9POAL|nr:unnamed protein product [Miscanthus lutarioriparius]
MLGGRPLCVLFGSSIVQYSFSNGGWGAALADIYARKADILLRGYIGWNTRRAVQVMDKVFPKDSAVQPSLVIVYFGGNDSIAAHSSGLGPHVPLYEYIGNMRKIAEHLKEMNLKVVDLWHAMQKREDWITACFTDGLHLSEEGSNIVVEEILKVLKEAEWEPCLHWKAMPTEFAEDSPFDLVSSSGDTTVNPSEWTIHRKLPWD